MLFQNAAASIERYNRLCLHYNLAADAVYRELRRSRAPFTPEYDPYLIAALIAFDMGRMMGSGLPNRYDPDAGGFARRLHQKLGQVQPLLDIIIHRTLFEIDLPQHANAVNQAYTILARGGEERFTERDAEFHVGATKILHFLNPELFLIVDRNAAQALNATCGIPYRSGSQPGYSGDLYVRSLAAVKAQITDYGIERFYALEQGTPAMRIFDKIAFAYSAFQSESR